MLKFKEELLNNHEVEIYDLDMVEVAMTHPSYGENIVVENYNKLEFLGDAVIKAILSEWLFNKFPNKDEGFYTKARIQMEKNTHLVKASKELHLDEYFIRGNSADIENSQGILADLFESLVGCIYIQNNYEVIKKFVYNNCAVGFDPHAICSYIAEINEFIQYKYKENIDVFKCDRETDGLWVCSVVDNGMSTLAYGKTKQMAKEKASKQFYEKHIESKKS